ncbi:MAG: 3-oxoacyl-[acyl-carrier-protein] synthase III C-terminal domain-containing protein [Pseudomonadota bacterium]|nr:3-oxoacyl-[acyl-carrier-protein] synthase III C-terminal domain-containing protein [Pseudomonadota bacterium]
MKDVGIASIAGYIPKLRLLRKSVAEANAWMAPNLVGKGKGTKSISNWDEDSVTMSVEAARRVLGPEDDRSYVDNLFLASTTMPFADRLNSGIIRAALTLDESTLCTDISSSLKCGTTALINAISTVQSGKSNYSLVVASDKRKSRVASSQELDFGDASTAVSISNENIIAKVLATASISDDFVDHFRGPNEEFDYNWEERWIRDEGYLKIIPKLINRLLKDNNINPSKIKKFILPCVFPRVPQTISKICGIDPENVVDNLALSTGDTGSAHSLLLLTHVLENSTPGEKILVCSFGGGGDAILLETTDLVKKFKNDESISSMLDNGIEETNYMKYLTFNDLVKWEKGMRGEIDRKTALTTLYRHNDAIMGLIGGKCSKTGTIQFPASRISVSPNSPDIDTQEPYKLAEKRANILSWSADYLSFSINPPNYYGIVSFEEGGRIMMDFTDVGEGEIESGKDVKMVFRIKAFDEIRGFTRYFWKAVPI